MDSSSLPHSDRMVRSIQPHRKILQLDKCCRKWRLSWAGKNLHYKELQRLTLPHTCVPAGKDLALQFRWGNNDPLDISDRLALENSDLRDNKSLLSTCHLEKCHHHRRNTFRLDMPNTMIRFS